MRHPRPRSSIIVLVMLCLPLLVAWFASRGNEAKPTPSAAAPVEGGIWHRVGPDEDLRAIARRYYGTGRLWRTLQLANDVGMQPAAGSEVWIPAALPGLP